MSLGYAEKLSYREDLGGQLGSPEIFDEAEQRAASAQQLADLIEASKAVIVFTGAGISTACGIPDFRGPNGVWTMQRAGKPLPKARCSFITAVPSLTHMAIYELVRQGKVTRVVSQNVDGLHLRSGIPRDKLAELHGNCFAERCPTCKKEYIRDFEIETMGLTRSGRKCIVLGCKGCLKYSLLDWEAALHGDEPTASVKVGFKRTGRKCAVPGCKGRLKDFILDWEDALPEDELTASEEAASSADLAICLGTSLQITPACDLPLRTPKAGGKLVIVNLQKTPKDKKAALLIRGRADEVMKTVMDRLQIPIPVYMRQDTFLIHLSQTSGGSEGISVEARVSSAHGPECIMPLVQSVDVSFPDSEGLRPGSLRKQPFVLRRLLPCPGAYKMLVIIHLVEAIDEKYRKVEHTCTITALGPSHEQNGTGNKGKQQKKRRKVTVEQSERVIVTTQDVHF